MLFRRKAHVNVGSPESLRISMVPDDGSFEGDDREVVTAGFWLFDANGERLYPNGPIVPGVWFCKVAGMTHRPPSALKALGPRKTVVLAPDPTNQHDAHAIKVHLGDAHIGFIPKEVAARLAPLLAEQRKNALVTKTYSVNGNHVGAEILFSVGPVLRLEDG